MMIREKYSAFFFDFDGVLADSVEVKTRAFAKLFESYGLKIQARVVDYHRKNGGMTRRDKFRYYYKEFVNKPLDRYQLEKLCSEFSSLVVDEVVCSPQIPGAEEFLQKWHGKLPCFIVSATPDEEIVSIVERRGLGRYFKETLGSSRSKKENLKILLEEYRLLPEKCLFFGDAESDYKAATDCGMNFMGILPGPDAPLLEVAPGISWVRSFVQLDIEEDVQGCRDGSQ